MFLFQTPDPLGGTFTNAHEVRLVGVFVPALSNGFQFLHRRGPSRLPLPLDGPGVGRGLVAEERGERLGQVTLDVPVLADKDLLEDGLVADGAEGRATGGRSSGCR